MWKAIKFFWKSANALSTIQFLFGLLPAGVAGVIIAGIAKAERLPPIVIAVLALMGATVAYVLFVAIVLHRQRPAEASPPVETAPDDLAPNGRPWINLSSDEWAACSVMLLKLDAKLVNEAERTNLSVRWAGNAPNKLAGCLEKIPDCRAATDKVFTDFEQFRLDNGYQLKLLKDMQIGAVAITAQQVFARLGDLLITVSALGPDIPEAVWPLVKKAAEPVAEANGVFGNAISNLRNEIKHVRDQIRVV